MKNKQKNSERLRRTVLCAMFAAIMCVLSPISVPIGPIPVSLGTFGVMLAALLLPPIQALASVSVFVALGAVGLPIFTGGRGGFAVLAGPTGGYIWGYILEAFVTSALAHLFLRAKFTKRTPLAATAFTLCAAVGLVLCYAAGTLWYCVLTGSGVLSALGVCVFPFIPFDLAKAVCASTLAALSRKHFAALTSKAVIL